MKRSGPPARRTPLRSGGRLPRRSTKRERQQEAWEEVRLARLDIDGWSCQAVGAPGMPRECWGGLHVHHVKRRSQGGKDELRNLVSLCALHHGWVHEHVAEARRLGFLV